MECAHPALITYGAGMKTQTTCGPTKERDMSVSFLVHNLSPEERRALLEDLQKRIDLLEISSPRVFMESAVYWAIHRSGEKFRLMYGDSLRRREYFLTAGGYIPTDQLLIVYPELG